MIDVHTFHLVGLVSQATFALTIGLLAWSDRRSRGMIWLAFASLSQFLSTMFRYLVPRDPHHFSEAIGSALVVLIFYCAYRGMQWFVVRHEQRSTKMPAFVSASIAIVSFVSIPSPSLARTISYLVVVSILLITIKMVWTPRLRALQFAARVCAVPMALMIFLLLFRVYSNVFLNRASRAATVAISREATLVIIPMLLLAFISLFIAEQKRRLHDETRTDALTGLYNRRAMEECALQAVCSANLLGSPLSLLMLDVDLFKVLNDTWGHWLGDRALHALGSVLLTGTNTNDITGRMGGEEFAVLLPGRDMHAATIVAERIRTAVEELRLNEAECTAHLTVSIGVSVLQPGERNWSDMLRRADKALYRAKREGRNRVIQHCDDVMLVDSLEHMHVFRGSGRVLASADVPSLMN